MTTLVNAQITDGEHLTGKMEFYTMYTLNALLETNYSANDAGQNTIRTMEIIGLGAQPVIASITAIQHVDLQTARTTYGFGSDWNAAAYADVTVYQLKFSFEHANVFSSTDTTGSVAGSLANLLATQTASLALPKVTAVGTGPTNLSAYTFSGNANSASLTISTVL